MRRLYMLASAVALVAALLIASPQAASAVTPDETLAQQVAKQLMENKNFDATDITVTAKDGIVHLRGQMRKGSEVKAMREAAKAVPGVKGVETQVDVAGQNTR